MPVIVILGRWQDLTDMLQEIYFLLVPNRIKCSIWYHLIVADSSLWLYSLYWHLPWQSRYQFNTNLHLRFTATNLNLCISADGAILKIVCRIVTSFLLMQIYLNYYAHIAPQGTGSHFHDWVRTPRLPDQLQEQINLSSNLISTKIRILLVTWCLNQWCHDTTGLWCLTDF